MTRSGQRDRPTGIPAKTRRKDGAPVPATAGDGTVLYRVRMWDPVLKKQIERVTAGVDAAEELLAEFNVAKRRPGRTQAGHSRFADAPARSLRPSRHTRASPRGTTASLP